MAGGPRAPNRRAPARHHRSTVVTRGTLSALRARTSNMGKASKGRGKGGTKNKFFATPMVMDSVD